MKDSNGEWNLFVFDASKNMWHKEDNLQVDCFCSCRGEMYAIADGEIITMLGSGTPDTEPVEWMAETGEIGTEYFAYTGSARIFPTALSTGYFRTA